MARHLLTIFSMSCALLGAAFACPDGAFKDPDDSNYCFTVHPELQSWSAAQDVCNSEGGYLVSVHDSRTNRLLKKLGEKGMDDSFLWIGANNNNGGGSTWTWADGTSFDFTRWGRGEPSAKNQGNGCALFFLANERWYNDDCNLATPFICRVSASWLLSTPSPSSSSPPSASSTTYSDFTTANPSSSSSPSSSDSTTYSDFTTPSPSSSSSPPTASLTTAHWLTTPQPSSSSSPSSSDSTTSEWLTTSYPTTSTPEGSF